MKILYVITKATLGGAQRYVYDLARAARARGRDVTVAHGAPGWLSRELDAARIPHVPLPSLARDVRFFGDARALIELFRVIRHVRPDVLHLNSSKAAAMGALAGRLLRIPRIIVTVHGWAFNEDRPVYERIAIYLVQWLTTLFAHLSITISHADTVQGKRLPGCRRKIVLVQNGIEPFARLEKRTAREQLRSIAAHLPAEGMWIGVIAELTRNKGVDVLIEAFERLNGDLDIHLVIIGGGVLHHQLTEQARRLRANQRIHFVHLGTETPARRFIAAFDMFVLPSRKEGLPYALLEAGLAALPVITTRVGGNPDIIEHDVSGVLVPPEDTEALQRELGALIEDGARRVRYGRALEKRVATLFTASRMAEETFSLYQPGKESAR